MGLLFVALVTAGVFGLVGAMPEPRKVKRALARARLDRVDTLRDGVAATIRGSVQPLDARAVVLSPLTSRPCVYWFVVFDELGAGGDYVQLGTAEGGGPFLLATAAGSARIVPGLPRVALLARTFLHRIAVLDERALDPVARLAQTCCKRPNHASSLLRASEYIIEPGQQVTIRGWCTREPDPEAADAVSGYRGQSPTRPVLSGSRAVRMMIA